METLKPKISVLLPIRQWTEHSLLAINSILNQSFTSLELLLIGREDVKTLIERVPKDSRIRLIARQAPGIVGALNTGIAAARGDYIARMDDDDVAYPERLQVQYDCLQSCSRTHLCATRIRFVDAAGSTSNIAFGNQSYERWLNSLVHARSLKLACYRECPMPHPTWMAHRSVWHGLGGYRQLDAPEDHDLILRAMLEGVLFCKPEPVLQDWRDHQHRLTHTDQRYRRAAFADRCAWAATRAQSALGLERGRGIWLCGTGRLARHWHDALIKYHANVLGFVDVSRPGPERSKRKLPVINYEQLTSSRNDALVITTLTQDNSRQNALDFMQTQSWQEGHDYLVGG